MELLVLFASLILACGFGLYITAMYGYETSLCIALCGGVLVQIIATIYHWRD